MEYFRIYNDVAELVSELTDEQAGRVLRAVFAYTAGRELPELDTIERLVFTTIRQGIDKDGKAYADTCKRNAENAQKGGAPKGNKNAKKQPNNRAVVLQNNPPKKGVKKQLNNRAVVLDEKGNGKPLQDTENKKDTKNNRAVVLDQKNDKKNNQTTARSKYNNNKIIINNNNLYNNSLSLSLSPLEVEREGDEVAERERVFEIFYFEKNFIEPKLEVDRFYDYYTANGWCRSGSQTPIKDRIALARAWKPQKEGARDDAELLSWIMTVYASVKAKNPIEAMTIPRNIEHTRIEYDDGVKNALIFCNREIAELIERQRIQTNNFKLTYKIRKTA